MCSDIAIEVSDISKCYNIYKNPADRLSQMIIPKIQRAFGLKQKKYYTEFWALNNLTFSIKKGETVGIIGRNGSGKSTILQIICGTLSPTVGEINTHGRIAALLELGSGFNIEFTGKENIYMNASILGLTGAEIENKYNEIITFADIGGFVDQPVKTYSSGMMMRLAFAVAINVDPDILIVDEALSVGDELFQRKCFSKIEAMRNAGTTILFVSHSGSQVVELCDRAILLDDGELLASGSPKNIFSSYQKLLYSSAEKIGDIKNNIINSSEIEENYKDKKSETENKQELLESFDPELKPKSTVVYESIGAVIQSPNIYTLDGKKVNCVYSGKDYIYSYDVNFSENVKDIRFGMVIKTANGIELGGIGTGSQGDGINNIGKGKTINVKFNFKCHLYPGTYFINAGCNGGSDLNGEEDTFLHRIIDAVAFRVLPKELNVVHTGYIDFGCENNPYTLSDIL